MTNSNQTTEYEIIHYASNYNMGDEMTESDCQEYRDFAKFELKKEYPNHDISVVNEDNLSSAWTDDMENDEEIQMFCKGLWNKFC